MSQGNVMITISGYSDPSCQAGDVIVVQNGSSLVAVSAQCPHQCCDVNYDGSQSQWVFSCPCHGAQFDITGKSAGIRTSKALAKLQVCQDGSGVHVSY
jgi:cytochrome b6-f complex iron-sulfur subunit